MSVFPVATARSLLTGRSTGRLIGFAYAFSWGLQQMIDFDFHEIALAVPLLAFSVSALVRRRPGATIAWAVPLVFVKEDQGFTVAAIGALMAATAVFPSLLLARPVFRRQTPAPAARAGTTATPRSWGGVFLVGWGLFWSLIRDHRDHPALQPAARVPLLGRAGRRRRAVGGQPGSVGACSPGWTRAGRSS